MTATTIRVQMAQRKDTAANWTAANPILLSGEIGYETDTEKFKIGDGTTNWNSLAYLPIPDGSGNLTITGNLEIGSTGTLTFEGSTADGFETTLAVTDPTADRTITLPDVSGTVVTTGDTGSVTSTMIADGTIVNADVSATAEIAVSKLANGTANQVLVTDGTDVSWSDDLTLAGNLTVNGTTTTVNTETLVVEDKNIELGVVGTPTDVTADGGGITLKGTTDKTINWVDSTDSWTSSEHVDLASGKSYRINGTEVLSSTTLGSGVTGSSLTSVGTLGSLTVTGSATAGTFIPTSSTVPTNGLYLPAANSVAISTNGAGRLRVTDGGQVLLESANSFIGVNTEDGTDTSTLLIGGGGAASNTRGAYVWMKGNENTDAGALVLSAGNVGTAPITAATGGSERLRITSDGKVGLGTSAPAEKLDIAADGPVLRLTDTDTTLSSGESLGEIHFYSSDLDNPGSAAKIRTFGLGAIGQVGMAFDVRGTGSVFEALRIDSAGRVGVLTTSPGVALHVNGDIRADGIYGETDTNTSIQFPGSDVITFNEGGSEAARIDSSGRLLVGTSSDSGGALLQVNGNRIRVATAKTPASASDTGTTGEICWDASYIYVCTATNTWKRAALSTW